MTEVETKTDDPNAGVGIDFLQLLLAALAFIGKAFPLPDWKVEADVISWPGRWDTAALGKIIWILMSGLNPTQMLYLVDEINRAVANFPRCQVPPPVSAEDQQRLVAIAQSLGEKQAIPQGILDLLIQCLKNLLNT